MRPFISQLALLGLSSLAVYALFFSVSLIFMPPQRQAVGMDTARASSTLFATEPKYVFLNRSMLNTKHNKVLLLGASNMAVGFKQDKVQQMIRAAEVNNLSVGGSNVTQLRQIVDLVHEVQSGEARRHNTFVIGMWYGLFVDDSQRWTTADRQAGDTDIDIERYRYGFFRRTEAGPVAVLPPQWLDLGVHIIHPYLVIDKLVRDATKTIRQMISIVPPATTDAQRNIKTVSEQDKHRYLAFWRKYMGEGKLSDSQFQTFALLVDEILATGGRVIVMNLPIPHWHEQGSPYQSEYRKRAHELLAALSRRSGVSVFQLQDVGEDDEFSDEVHPKPRVAEQWAQQLAVALNDHFGKDGGVNENVASGELPKSALHQLTTVSK